MKFLIVALCVAAASAASVRAPLPAWQQRSAVASAQAGFVAPLVKVPEVVRSSGFPVGSEVSAKVLRSDSDVRPDGYTFAFETENGIVAESSGALKKVGEGEAVAIQGSYRFTSPEGVPVGITYVADENGYQPQGDVLPVGPAVPEAILRSLEYIRTHVPKDVKNF